MARLLEAIRSADAGIRFYQASTVGALRKGARVTALGDHTLLPAQPLRRVQGLRTLDHHQLPRVLRHVRAGILFNHESPRRGLEFVSRKTTNGVARIEQGRDSQLLLGNLDSRRDWGYAVDFVRAMWMKLQQERPDDFVIATGRDRTIREFCEAAFGCVGPDREEYAKVDERFLRSAEVEVLRGDPSKARRVLGWKPEVSFEEMVAMKVERDTELVALEK